MSNDIYRTIGIEQLAMDGELMHSAFQALTDEDPKFVMALDRAGETMNMGDKKPTIDNVRSVLLIALAEAGRLNVVPENEKSIHVQFAAAFELWETRFRDQPIGFLTAEEVAALAVANVSQERAIYFTALLREVISGR